MKKAKTKNVTYFYNEIGDYTIIENVNNDERILGFCKTEEEAKEEVIKLIRAVPPK